ncbi:MAG: hypothetical protein Terrestrivirus9_40 [Terrestrivirus sp.]|uniref:t-SNARE coiled-coil homology domain-containing protein n=1 Tax=Terrestrivirus sp. TaxID=2487775 RepID=A0A3G4ZSM7_9VIRU|nr:MAG: hypothetical protein Terrestrivirus9_40 [Terrestrivirus sp.]
MPAKYDETNVVNNLNTLSLTVNNKMARKDIIFSTELIKETRNILKTISTKKLREYNQRLDDYEAIINRLQLIQTSAVNNVDKTNNYTNNGNYGDDGNDGNDGNEDHGLSSGQRGIDMLKKSIAILDDTQQTGADTMEELARQREKLEKARDNMREIDHNISESQRLLTKMSTWWRRITS